MFFNQNSICVMKWSNFLNLTEYKSDDIIHKHLRISSCGGIGRRNGLKIRRSKIRTGSSPVTSTTVKCHN